MNVLKINVFQMDAQRFFPDSHLNNFFLTFKLVHVLFHHILQTS